MELNYNLTIRFGTDEFDRIQRLKTGGGRRFLLPQDVRISEIVLELTPNRALLMYSYFAKKGDGTEHQRRTNDTFVMKSGNGRDTSLKALLGAEHITDYYDIRRFWPTQEPACGATYEVGDGTTIRCRRNRNHPTVEQDGIGHSPAPDGLRFNVSQEVRDERSEA